LIRINLRFAVQYIFALAAVLQKRNTMEVSLNVDSSSIASDFPHGLALLRDPLLNKGTAFSERERTSRDRRASGAD
jgi:hypothetical protein